MHLKVGLFTAVIENPNPRCVRDVNNAEGCGLTNKNGVIVSSWQINFFQSRWRWQVSLSLSLSRYRCLSLSLSLSYSLSFTLTISCRFSLSLVLILLSLMSLSLPRCVSHSPHVFLVYVMVRTPDLSSSNPFPHPACHQNPLSVFCRLLLSPSFSACFLFLMDKEPF